MPNPHDESSVYAVVLGRVVAMLREQRGWSQVALARHVQIAQSSMSRIESGAVLPDMYVFRRLAEAFGMSSDELNRIVEQSIRETEQTALRQARSQVDASAPWWMVALGVAGVAGLAAVVTLAVAAVLAPDDRR